MRRRRGETATADLLDRFRSGDRTACGKVLTLAEDGGPDYRGIEDDLFPATGRAFRVGITGSPGAGKSTVIDALVRVLRSRGDRVGVVAVDPSSPFTGGAILGDRVRMLSAGLDDGVFVRSMAHRGHAGGLARRTLEVADVLDAFGCQTILIETLGVGQGELEVAGAVDETVVVLFPGAGDEMQTLKAGLLEVADVFFVNKADLPGAEDLAEEVRTLRSHSLREEGRTIPVLLGSARSGEGVEKLLDTLIARRDEDERSGRLAVRREEALRGRVRRLARESLERWLEGSGALRDGVRRAVRAGGKRRSPSRIAAEVLSRLEVPVRAGDRRPRGLGDRNAAPVGRGERTRGERGRKR